HEPGGGVLERLNAVVGVAAVFELVDLLFANLAHQGIGHVVVFADAEIEELPLGVGRQDGAFGPFDLLELVDFGALAVVGAADAVGEQRLEPGVGLHESPRKPAADRAGDPGGLAMHFGSSYGFSWEINSRSGGGPLPRRAQPARGFYLTGAMGR